MNFQLLPTDIPSPATFLRAGLVRPDNGPHNMWRNAAVSATDATIELDEFVNRDALFAPASTSFLDPSGTPVATLFTKPQTYIAAPVTFSLFNEPLVSVSRSEQGFYSLQLGKAEIPSRRISEASSPLDLATARLVTIDSSVLFTGVDKTKFSPDDGLLVSAALDSEAALVICEGPGLSGEIQRSPRWKYWDSTVPVPVGGIVRRLFVRLTQQVDVLAGVHRELDKTDLWCAATAIAYGAVLYTTHPESYVGLKNGLKVAKYGPVRNAEALKARKAREQARAAQDLAAAAHQLATPEPPAHTIAEPALDDAAEQESPAATLADAIAAFDRGDDLNEHILQQLDQPVTDVRTVGAFLGRVFDGADDQTSLDWQNAILDRADIVASAVRVDFQNHDDIVGAVVRRSYSLAEVQQEGSPEYARALRVLGLWGNWPQDASNDLLTDLALDPTDELLLDRFRVYLAMARISPDVASQAEEDVRAGVLVPSLIAIDALR